VLVQENTCFQQPNMGPVIMNSKNGPSVSRGRGTTRMAPHSAPAVDHEPPGCRRAWSAVVDNRVRRRCSALPVLH
jgi:hypothetical protein